MTPFHMKGSIPGEHTTLKQCRFNVDSTSQTSLLKRCNFNVVCPLGIYIFRSGEALQAVLGSPLFGQGEGRVWINGVKCKGTENRLHDCEFPGWGVNECRHTGDVAVQCIPKNDLKDELDGTQLSATSGNLPSYMCTR